MRSISSSHKQFPIKYDIQLSFKMLDNLIANGQNIYQSKQENGLQPQLSPESKGKNPQTKMLYAYSKRSLLNILLIIFCTIEVILITNSKVYIDSSLVRSFLMFYADQNLYPQVFDGNAYYIHIQDVSELQQNMQYMLAKMANSPEETINNLNFSSALITLQVQYHADVQKNENQTTYVINPSQGIIEPFDLSNLTAIQLFLLKTHFFEIVVTDLEIKNQGLDEQYIHRVMYHYDENSQVSLSFNFDIDNVIKNTVDADRPQAYELLYLRIFYLTIIVIAFMSFYFNTLYVRRAFKELYTYLEHKRNKKPKLKRRDSIFQELNSSEIKEIDKNIYLYVESSSVDINSLRWKDYMRIVEFDVIFAMLASSLQIISNFYLLFGREHEEVIGLGCLFAWMTIFRLLQNYKKLTLMYELLKLSILRVIEFSTSFFLIFMGFTFMGVTVFPKVRFFASVSDSVTTLISMMAGDSIDLITMEIREKYNSTIAIAYIFSYVIIFMHAIHNTLTSIIKEYFILRKIELMEEEKEKLGESHFLYIEEIPLASEKTKKELPIKLTFSLQRDLYRLKAEQNLKVYEKLIREMIIKLQGIFLHEKMDIIDHDDPVQEQYRQDLLNRMVSLRKTTELLSEIYNKSEAASLRKKSITNEQL